MASGMIRTQIYLSERQHRLLKERAEGSHKTMAALAREAIDRYLAGEQDRTVFPSDDPIFELVGIFESDTDDGAVDHDRYLYGIHRERR